MGWVYFIRSGARGPFKIGTTIHTPHSRARGLQTGNPEELHVVAAVQGGPELEARLHGRFASSHLRGEWFNPTQELVAFIEGIRLSHAQPEDDGAVCPFTDEQLQWLQGWHAALHEDAVASAYNNFAVSFGSDALAKASLYALDRVVDSCRALDTMATSTPYDGCNCCDGTCLACVGRGRAGADVTSVDALTLEQRADECIQQHGLTASTDRWESAPVTMNALEWLHGALSVALGIDRLHMVRFDDAPDKRQHGEDALRALDRVIGVASNEPWKTGVEFGQRFYRVDEYKSRFRARFSDVGSPAVSDDDEPESVDRALALSTIMLGIGGDGS